MDGAFWQDSIKTLALQYGHGTIVTQPCRSCAGHQRIRLLLVAWKDDETVPAPAGISESRLHRMSSVYPAIGLSQLSGGF